MRVYHFINEKYGLRDLSERHLKIARIMELNDLFEFLGVDLSNRDFRKAIKETKAELSKSNGLLCFSKNWRNPVLWSHYADKHKGLCFGFDMPVIRPTKVKYVKLRFPPPALLDEAFVKKLLFTKFIHWKYEEEYRAYVSLKEEIDGLYYYPFSDSLVLRQIIVGERSTITRAQINTALGNLTDKVEVFKARAGFTSFEVVRNRDESLWA